MYEFTGTIRKVCDTQTFASGFSKRDLVVEEDRDTQWPNPVAFTFKKENTAKLDGLSEGTRVKIGFVIDGREWTDPKTGNVRYFTDLTALRLDLLNDSSAPDAPADDFIPEEPLEDLDGDIPF